MTSVCVVGNCRIYSVQRSLKFHESTLMVEGCYVTELGTRFRSPDAILDHIRDFSHVLTIPFGTEFMSSIDSALIVVFPTVTFGAFHLDVIYLPSRTMPGEVLMSPLGSYYSALVLYGYHRRYTIAQTMALFRKNVFEALGYLSACDMAMEKLGVSPKAKAFGLPAMVMRWLRQGCFMHNPQHPKLGPICDIARSAMTRAGIAVRPSDPSAYLPDDLLASHIWPVYPEIASYYGVPGSYVFERESGQSRWPEFMTLQEFVTASFQCYAEAQLHEHWCDRVDGWLVSGLNLR